MRKAIVSAVALLLLLRCTYAALQAQHRHHHNKHHEAYRGGELIYQAGAYKDAQRIAQPLMKQHKYDSHDSEAATTIIRPLSHHASPFSDPNIPLAKPPQDGLPKKTFAEDPLPMDSLEADKNDDYRYHPHRQPTSSSSSSSSSADYPGEDHLPPIGPPTRDSNQWAIVYYPYTASSSCKPASTIRSDIASISANGFTTIRLHASDCNALQTVGSAALLHGIRMIVGIQIDEDSGIDELAHAQVDELIGWATSLHLSSPRSPAASSSTANGTVSSQEGNGWSLIELLTIGEETIYNSPTTSPLYPHHLTSFIQSTRLRLRAAGYTGPITTIEPIPTLHEHRETLCPALDIPASNIHPFFVDSVAAGDAGAYVSHALSILSDICAGIPGPRPGSDEPSWPASSSSSSDDGAVVMIRALNLETGWPHKGRANGRASPGRVEQMVAVAGIMKAAGRRSVVLGWGDDEWKDEGEWGVEGGWGCEGLFAPPGGVRRYE